MGTRRSSPRGALLAAVVGALVLGGCAREEGLRSGGAVADSVAPLSLWKETRPVPAASGERPGPAVVPGVPAVRDGDMRHADVLRVVKADVADAAVRDGGSGRLVHPGAVRRMASCAGTGCPVRTPVLHDLTGDGKDDLITAVDADGRVSELRVYTAREDTVVRVLARRAVLEGVEVAGRHLAVREPTSNPEFVSVSDYTWTPGRGAMLLTWLSLDSCRTAQFSSPCPEAARP